MAFEAFLKQEQEPGSRPRRSWKAITLACSLMLHGAGALAATAQSFWHVEELQPPTVRVTFTTRLPPPPPPPPAPVAKAPEAPKPVKAPPRVAMRKPQPVPTLVPAITQPAADSSPRPPAEAAPGPEDRAGVATGSASAIGGVPGGAPALAAPPPPKPVEQPPMMLPPNVGVGQRTTDINDPRFRPSLPRAMKMAGATVWGLFRICVDAEGRVKEVKVLKSADALVDPEWIAVVKRWSYRPYQLDGRAVPFCHAARIEVKAGY